MGSVLLLTCLLFSNSSMGLDCQAVKGMPGGAKMRVTPEEKTAHAVPGMPDAAALSAFMEKANVGDERARNVLGIMYAFGIGVEADSERGADLFSDAALEKGARYVSSFLDVVKAMMPRADMFNNLASFPSEEEEERLTYRMLKNAVKSQDKASQLALGMVYASGSGVDKDFVQAASWITKAAGQGDALAQVLLGMMYETGMGVPLDRRVSDMWYARSEAHSPLTEAETQALQQQFLTVTFGYLEETLARLLEFAEKGDREAQFRLGDFYEMFDVENGDGAAYAWYKKAALQEHAQAQYALGLMYEEGRGGVARNEKEALVWFKKAAVQHNLEAMKKVAVLQ